MKQTTTKRTVIVLIMMMLTTMTAWANDAVTYIDMDGKTKTVTEYTEVTTDMTANGNGNINWFSGTYVVKSSVTLNGCIRYDGKVIDLIVCDGATLIVNGSSNGAFNGNTLNIYAQSNGTGMGVVNVKKHTKCNQLNIAGGKVTLDDDGVGYSLYVLSGDACGLTVNGGDVTIQNSDDLFGAIYFAGNGFVTLNGGKLTVTNSIEDGYTAIEGQDTNTINFNGGTAVINGKIRDFNNINLNSGNVTVNGEIFNDWGYTVTYDFTRATDSYYINAFSNDLTRTVQVKDGVTFLCDGKSYSGTLSNKQISAISGQRMTPDLSDDFSWSDDTYTIHTAKGWGYFCDMLEAGETFSGKTIVLAGDIGTPEDPVTRMGSSTTQFQGTFDGNVHTLTVQYGTPSEPVNQQFVAPFPKVAGGATFRSLTIAGSIYSGYATSVDKGTGGLIGCLFGSVTVEHCVSTLTVNAASDRAGGFVGHCEHAVTFTDCVSSAIVTCTGSGSGFVGWSRASEYTIAFEGCLFDGKVLKKNDVGSGNGSFVGWKGFSKTVTITNCIAAPAADENMATDNSATFCRYSADTTKDNQATTITNSYYTCTLGTAQGNARHSITAGENVTIDGLGAGTEYSVSGITAYPTGIKYNDVYYAGSGDQVSLTLTNTAPDGYSFDGYTVSVGTLSGSANPYALTMPDADVTISAALRSNRQPVTVAFINADGTTGEASAIALDGHEAVDGNGDVRLAAGTYYVGTDIAYANRISPAGDITLILADGKTMTLNGKKQGIFNDGNNLTIYGQSLDDDAGTLRYDGSSVGIHAYNYEQHSGNVRITTTGLGMSGIYASVTLRGGTLTISANGDYACAINGYTLSILGGQLTATATGDTATGILASADDGTALTLGWTRPADRITASSISAPDGGTVAVADGKVFTDGNGHNFYGTITDVSTLADKTLQPAIPYIKADGTTAYCTNFTVLTDGGAQTLPGGWYVVNSNISHSGMQLFQGDTHIILADDATMTITQDGNDLGFYSEEGSLTIYGQTAGSGALNVTSLRAIYADDNFTINGGNITANGIDLGIGATNIIINGGNVSANSDSNGIEASGNITLGWTKATDQIYASSYEGTVTIADDKTLYNGTEGLSGTITDMSKLNDKTLRTYDYRTVSYVKADGTTGSADAIPLTGGGATTLQPGWYVVNSDINYTGTVTLGNGEVNIILADGGKMNIGTEQQPVSECGINGYNFSESLYANLTIYGQTNGTGELNIYSTENGIYTLGCTQHGGMMTIDALENGIDSETFTITDGTLNVKGKIKGISSAGDISILGGKCTVSAEELIALWPAYGNIILGWTKATDQIYVSSYSLSYGNAVVKVADGQALIDADGNIYTGTIGTGDNYTAYSVLNGKKLKPALLLTDNADNSAQVAALDGLTTTVILQGRTLYKDGAWNTICLPFAVSSFTGTPLEGADVRALDNANLTDGTLTLNFTDEGDVTAIEAGVPYIVKWDKADGYDTADPDTRDLKNPVFSGVTIDNSDAAITRKTQTSTDGTVSFKGTYASITYTEENKSILFVGGNNSLYWPTADASIGAQRAYFELNDGQQARNIVLNFFDEQSGKAERDNDNATGIHSTTNCTRSSLLASLAKNLAGAYYTLDGRKLAGKPTAPGIYVKDGHKVAIKREK